MPGLQGRRLFPVFGRQRHSPNVSRLIKFDPTVQRVLWIDVDNASLSTLVRQVDVRCESLIRGLAHRSSSSMEH